MEPDGDRVLGVPIHVHPQAEAHLIALGAEDLRSSGHRHEVLEDAPLVGVLELRRVPLECAPGW